VVFGPVWAALYASAAGAGASMLERVPVQDRHDIERALWLNMGLNAGWCWLFFTAEKPRWALGEILLLQASTLDLVRRAHAAGDDRAALALAPYVGWNAFATALNVAIVRRNP
jgi:tryptophan-rich sensory protein